MSSPGREFEDDLTDARFLELVGWFLEASHEKRRAVEEIEQLAHLEKTAEDELLSGRSALGLAELRSRREIVSGRKAEIEVERRVQEGRLEFAEGELREAQESLLSEGMPTMEWIRIGGHGELAAYLDEGEGDARLALLPWKDVAASPVWATPDTMRRMSELREKARRVRKRGFMSALSGLALLLGTVLLYVVVFDLTYGIGALLIFLSLGIVGATLIYGGLGLTKNAAEIEDRLQALGNPEISAMVMRILGR